MGVLLTLSLLSAKIYDHAHLEIFRKATCALILSVLMHTSRFRPWSPGLDHTSSPNCFNCLRMNGRLFCIGPSQLCIIEEHRSNFVGLSGLKEQQIFFRLDPVKGIVRLAFPGHAIKALYFPVQRESVCGSAVVHELFHDLGYFGV